jgi:hypothetical protein
MTPRGLDPADAVAGNSHFWMLKMRTLVSQAPSAWCSKIRTVLPDNLVDSPLSLTMTTV